MRSRPRSRAAEPSRASRFCSEGTIEYVADVRLRQQICIHFECAACLHVHECCHNGAMWPGSDHIDTMQYHPHIWRVTYDEQYVFNTSICCRVDCLASARGSGRSVQQHKMQHQLQREAAGDEDRTQLRTGCSFRWWQSTMRVYIIACKSTSCLASSKSIGSSK